MASQKSTLGLTALESINPSIKINPLATNPIKVRKIKQSLGTTSTGAIRVKKLKGESDVTYDPVYSSYIIPNQSGAPSSRIDVSNRDLLEQVAKKQLFDSGLLSSSQQAAILNEGPNFFERALRAINFIDPSVYVSALAVKPVEIFAQALAEGDSTGLALLKGAGESIAGIPKTLLYNFYDTFLSKSKQSLINDNYSHIADQFSNIFSNLEQAAKSKGDTENANQWKSLSTQFEENLGDINLFNKVVIPVSLKGVVGLLGDVGLDFAISPAAIFRALHLIPEAATLVQTGLNLDRIRDVGTLIKSSVKNSEVAQETIGNGLKALGVEWSGIVDELPAALQQALEIKSGANVSDDFVKEVLTRLPDKYLAPGETLQEVLQNPDRLQQIRASLFDPASLTSGVTSLEQGVPGTASALKIQAEANTVFNDALTAALAETDDVKRGQKILQAVVDFNPELKVRQALISNPNLIYDNRFNLLNAGSKFGVDPEESNILQVLTKPSRVVASALNDAGSSLGRKLYELLGGKNILPGLEKVFGERIGRLIGNSIDTEKVFNLVRAEAPPVIERLRGEITTSAQNLSEGVLKKASDLLRSQTQLGEEVAIVKESSLIPALLEMRYDAKGNLQPTVQRIIDKFPSIKRLVGQYDELNQNLLAYAGSQGFVVPESIRMANYFPHFFSGSTPAGKAYYLRTRGYSGNVLQRALASPDTPFSTDIAEAVAYHTEDVFRSLANFKATQYARGLLFAPQSISNYPVVQEFVDKFPADRELSTVKNLTQVEGALNQSGDIQAFLGVINDDLAKEYKGLRVVLDEGDELYKIIGPVEEVATTPSGAQDVADVIQNHISNPEQFRETLQTGTDFLDTIQNKTIKSFSSFLETLPNKGKNQGVHELYKGAPAGTQEIMAYSYIFDVPVKFRETTSFQAALDKYGREFVRAIFVDNKGKLGDLTDTGTPMVVALAEKMGVDQGLIEVYKTLEESLIAAGQSPAQLQGFAKWIREVNKFTRGFLLQTYSYVFNNFFPNMINDLVANGISHTFNPAVQARTARLLGVLFPKSLTNDIETALTKSGVLGKGATASEEEIHSTLSVAQRVLEAFRKKILNADISKLSTEDQLLVTMLREDPYYKSMGLNFQYLSDVTERDLITKGTASKYLGAFSNKAKKIYRESQHDPIGAMYMALLADQSHFISMAQGFLKQSGGDTIAASKLLREHFRRFQDLTPFEKTISRNLFSFYIWTSQNFRASVKQIFAGGRPAARISALVDLMGSLQDETMKEHIESLNPDDWQRNNFWAGNSDHLMMGIQLPFQNAIDYSRMLAWWNPQMAATAVAQQFNYPLSMLVSLGLNKDPRTLLPINPLGDPNIKADVVGYLRPPQDFVPLLKTLPDPIKEALEFVEFEDPITKKTEYRMNPQASYFLSRNPIRMFNYLTQVAKGGPDGVFNGDDLLTFATRWQVMGTAQTEGLVKRGENAEKQRLQKALVEYGQAEAPNSLFFTPQQAVSAGLPVTQDTQTKAAAQEVSPLNYYDFNKQYQGQQSTGPKPKKITIKKTALPKAKKIKVKKISVPSLYK